MDTWIFAYSSWFGIRSTLQINGWARDQDLASWWPSGLQRRGALPAQRLAPRTTRTHHHVCGSSNVLCDTVFIILKISCFVSWL
jgi:hypothetical protein